MIKKNGSLKFGGGCIILTGKIQVASKLQRVFLIKQIRLLRKRIFTKQYEK
jgi:hypothetical protein